MKQTPDQQDRYENSFGYLCTRLRKQMRLSRCELAKLLALSTHTIQLWEYDVCPPTPAHLSHLFALALQRQAFPQSQEYLQARQLWLATHQPAANFDAFWMQIQLSVPQTRMVLKQETVPTSKRQTHLKPVDTSTRLDWGEAPDVRDFYGRQAQCSQLEQWIIQERCQLVNILGMAGIGKSALAVTLMHQVAPAFQCVVFRSIRNAPACLDLLTDCLQVLSPQPITTLPTSVEQCLALLLHCFQAQRCLLVLDNLESLLQEQDPTGRYRSGYEDYALLLRQVGETAHQSCLLVTGRETPAELEQWASRQTQIRQLHLTGLSPEDCEHIFARYYLMGTTHERLRLTQMYAGNPLALKIVAEFISELFGGEIAPFLEQNTTIFSSVHDLLTEQFVRLSTVERTLLIWLAIVREPLALSDLRSMLVPPISNELVAGALEALQRRSLLERDKQNTSFTLQSVVLEYVTEVLIEQISLQIQQGKWADLTCYALEQAGAKEYVRQAQERLIVTPIITNLRAFFRQKTVLETHLLHMLEKLRELKEEVQGYGPANLILLLRALRGHLRGLNLSRLNIRSTSFQQIEMQDTTLVGATFRDTIFTETFDAIAAIAISRDGKYWAAGSKRGEVRIWSEEGQTLHLVQHAHTNDTFALAFSPDERLLASGSTDGSIKCWEIASGALLWSGWHTGSIASLAFAPDGSVLASDGHDATIRLWDPEHGTLLQDITHPGPLVALAWSHDGRLLASGDFQGHIWVWQIRNGQLATCIQTIMGHTDMVMGLTFSLDDNLLASGSWDGTISLWELASGRLHLTFVGHTDRVQRIALSPDGHTLASGGFDHTIWLWDIDQGKPRMVLQGHTSVVNGLAFTPDGLSLVSGNDDGTLRVWNVASGRCLRVIQGYQTCLFDIDWSPDGTQIASAGVDTLITIWNLANQTPLKMSRGHCPLAYSVAWSPDGKTLASSGWDNAIRLWEPTTGRCLDQQHDYDHMDTLFCGVAWSPDGHQLAVGTLPHGILIWDVMTHTQYRINHPPSTWVRRVAWSPDGSWLAAGDEDGHVYVWEVTKGIHLQQFLEHNGVIMSVAWSPDGTRLASAGHWKGNGYLLVWNIQHGQYQYAFHGSIGTIHTVTWEPSGEILISGGNDGILRWWDVQSGECLRWCQAHQGTVHALKVSPDGQTLASCGDDGAIRLWNLHTSQHLHTLRRDRPYERLDITGIHGLNEHQKKTLHALGAIDYSLE